MFNDNFEIFEFKSKFGKAPPSTKTEKNKQKKNNDYWVKYTTMQKYSEKTMKLQHTTINDPR